MCGKWQSSWGIRRKREAQASKVAKLEGDLDDAQTRLAELEAELSAAIKVDLAVHRQQIAELSSELTRAGGSDGRH
jgi:septal ring factor EnvC (AmiA/AmiB activator)